MNRTSFAALALLTSFVTLAGSGCSSDDPVPGGTAGTGTTPTAGTGTAPTAGTGSTPTAGTSAGGSGTAGSTTTAGTGGAAAGSGGTGGSAGAATGGGGAATGGTGGSAGAATGGGGTGGTGSGTCPAKIDSSTVCTAVASCPGTTCGIHKLGARDCSCAAASGNFMCNACTYTGTETIVAKPETALSPCAMADSAMEDLTTCTKGDRCKSLDTTKDRFCACWDPAGTPVYDCDSTPSAWK